ncbi:MAG TPA: hypothetical protein VGH21_01065, partial [Solirubrobacteraceae bacterium]
MGAASETRNVGSAAARPSLAKRLRDRREQAWLLVDLLVVAWLIWLFDAINNLAPVRQQLSEHDGELVLGLEHSLHLAPEHALNT